MRYLIVMPDFAVRLDARDQAEATRKALRANPKPDREKEILLVKPVIRMKGDQNSP